ALRIIEATFAAEAGPRPIGAGSGLGGGAGAVGPFVGGWIIGSVGWRWIFLLTLPLAAAVVAVTVRHVPETRDPTSHGRFDWAGAILAPPALARLTEPPIAAPPP